MENNFVIFDYKNLGSVRTYLDERNEIWFCLADVTNVIGISNNRNVKARLNENGVHSMDIIDSMNRIQTVIFIDEGNLYQCILGSRKKEVKPFVDWVTREVIPSIRKNGYYDMRNLSYSEKVTFVLDNMNKDLQEFKRNVNDRFIKERRITDNRMKDLKEDVAEMVAENKRIEETIRIGFRPISAFVSYLGISENSIDEFDFAFDVETFCEERGIAYVSTNVPGYGIYKAYPFEVMMEVYNNTIGNN